MDNEKIIIIGLGASGIGAAKLLKAEGFCPIVLEKNRTEELSKTAEELRQLDILVELGINFDIKNIKPWISQCSTVIISPSIPWDNITVDELRKKGIIVKSEISLAWEKLNHIPWIGITGTNGKSTVTEMLNHVFRKNNIFTLMGGNIGKAATDLALSLIQEKDKSPNWLIMELSSYQIESAQFIKPKIGLWTTFSPDHLDRHKNIDSYFKIKRHLLENSEIRIYNGDDKSLLANRVSLPKGIWVTADKENRNIYSSNYWINKEGFVMESQTVLFHSSVLAIPGKHNLQNLLLVTAASRHAGITGESIGKAMQSFKGIAHRLEYIGNLKDIKVYNDSKATNFDSSYVGISSVASPLILLAGGELKEGNSSDWLNAINEKSKSVILFGKSSKALKTMIIRSGYKEEIVCVDNIDAAVDEAIRLGVKLKAKVILLSPACASFDQFQNFEHRGNYFKKLINQHHLFNSFSERY